MTQEQSNRTILCVVPMNEEQRARLEAATPGCTIEYSTIKDATPEQAQAADIILGNVASEKIAGSPRLAFMQLNSAGADHIKGLAPTTLLSTASGAYGQAVSEHALALLFCLMKKLYLYRDHQASSEWVDEGAATSLVGARVLVMGSGNIGCAFARLVRAMGARVTGMKRDASVIPDGCDEVCTSEDLERILPEMDVVVSFLPSGPSTDGMADATFFARMKRSAYFVNAGRGSLVDQEALRQALENGEIAAAAIDVATPEPLPADSPLWAVRNLVITPHVAGGYHLAQTLANVVDICIENAGRFVRGEQPRNLVSRR